MCRVEQGKQLELPEKCVYSRRTCQSLQESGDENRLTEPAEQPTLEVGGGLSLRFPPGGKLWVRSSTKLSEKEMLSSELLKHWSGADYCIISCLERSERFVANLIGSRPQLRMSRRSRAWVTSAVFLQLPAKRAKRVLAILHRKIGGIYLSRADFLASWRICWLPGEFVLASQAKLPHTTTVHSQTGGMEGGEERSGPML